MRCWRIAPGHVGALVNRGNTLLRFNQPVKAIASYDKALAAMPGHPQILTNRGHALRRLDRPVEALADFEAALAAAPEFPEAHFEAAMTQLSLGDFDAGWKAYEWRWKTGAFARQRRQLQAPLWLGDAPLSGKTILLHAEQGFGDTIQFIRYAPLLAGRGAKVVCEVQPELLPLLWRSSRTSQSSPPASRCRHSICIVPCSVFPWRSEPSPRRSRLRFRISPPPAERLAYWRDRLPPGRPARRIRLVRPAVAQERRQPLDRACRVSPHCSRIRRSGVSVCSATCATRMAKSLRGLPNLVHLGGEFRDFADTAAVISLLDVVVSVDTAVAHLAGALGKPVVILLPYAADFRWMRDRDDSPWYPTREAVAAAGLWRLGQRDRPPARRIAAIEPAGSRRAGVRISLTTSIYCLVTIAAASAASEPFMTEQIHLVVATPCFGGQVSSIYASSIFQLQRRRARQSPTSTSRSDCATAMR